MFHDLVNAWHLSDKAEAKTMVQLPTKESTSGRIASVYLRFAEREAHGRSALYEDLARGVASEPAALSFLADLPPPKQQPNLLFAAVKYLYGTPSDWRHFERLLNKHWDEIKALMMVRSTQTNEPARCATLLPLLARLTPPLALLEVGAAAGLCLLPDRYAYDYAAHQVAPSSAIPGSAPTFFCRANQAPLPSRGLEIVWRLGLDLQPIDTEDPEQTAWLEALVWPDEGNRLELLRAALEVARYDPPRVVQGDLRFDLPALVAQMPKDVTRVVFHTAVLGYVRSANERAAFARTLEDLNIVWVSNEPPELFPELAQSLSPRSLLGQFLLTMNRRPVAWTDPHGASLDWIADPSRQLRAKR
jgi:hypothetical protein